MKIADFLEQHELSGSALSKALGFTGAEAVNSRRRRDEDIPEAWLPRLAELGYAVDGRPPVSHGPGPAEEIMSDLYRAGEREPLAPADAPQAPAAVVIDYATVQGYI